MRADLITSFLTYYVRSLAERTRVEKTGTKNGFIGAWRIPPAHWPSWACLGHRVGR